MNPELEKFKEELKEYFDNKMNELRNELRNEMREMNERFYNVERRLYNLERGFYDLELRMRRHERYHRILDVRRKEEEDFFLQPYYPEPQELHHFLIWVP